MMVEMEQPFVWPEEPTSLEPYVSLDFLVSSFSHLLFFFFFLLSVWCFEGRGKSIFAVFKRGADLL